MEELFFTSNSKTVHKRNKTIRSQRILFRLFLVVVVVVIIRDMNKNANGRLPINHAIRFMKNCLFSVFLLVVENENGGKYSFTDIDLR